MNATHPTGDKFCPAANGPRDEPAEYLRRLPRRQAAAPESEDWKKAKKSTGDEREAERQCTHRASGRTSQS
jgi:hypothetical protein